MSDARLVQTASLDEPVSTMRFVQGARAEQLAHLDIYTRRDLIENYPRRYLDMSQVVDIETAQIGQTVTVVGVVGEVNVKRPRPRLVIVEVSVIDDSGVMFGTWFRQPWIADRIHAGDRVTFSGKVEFNYGYRRMNSPFFEVISTHDEEESTLGRVIAIHPLTEGISSAWMRRLVATALGDADVVCDPLPAPLRIEHDLMDRASAFRLIHFPSSLSEADEARKRLAYEELIELQLFLQHRRNVSTSGLEAVRHNVTGPLFLKIRSAMPFELTDEQESAWGDIACDMSSANIMNRMLLGDVGTGKTAVALLAIAAACDSGHQACMMAPTSVLAQQYQVKLGPLLDAVGISWALLSGATPADERDNIISALGDGGLSVVFGTHALLVEDVIFSDLSLVVIDEQHRFGVEQRSALRAKGPRSDLLVMTATPIPRTLALTLYGDLDCSYLHRRPNGEIHTTTTVLSKRTADRAYEAVRKAHKCGNQAYIVCPLVGNKTKKEDEEDVERIDESIADGVDVSDVKAAEQEQRFLAAKVFPDMHVGLMTGRMRSDEKQRVMDDFRAGHIDVLVSTTVIEVGVDVPAATVMVVQDAERFGLSQLHQLRGRVGRGSQPGQMYLIANARSDEAKARLGAMKSTDDGFELAEYDLRLRHEGDVLGCRQHGYPAMKLVDVSRDRELIEIAHEDAKRILEEDPSLASDTIAPLAEEVSRRFAAVVGQTDGA